VAWIIPRSGIGGEKSKLAQARLQEFCCFSAPFSWRLHLDPSLSVPIRVIRGQNAFGGSAVIDSRYSISREKISEIFLKRMPLQPMPDRVMVAQVWKRKLNE